MRHFPWRYLRKPEAAVLVVSAIAAAFAAARVGQAAEPGITVENAWFRFILPSRPVGGYFTITNHSATSRTLVGAQSPACGMLMLHRSLRQGGMDRMASVESVAVPAHGQLTFGPGGYHLMCLSPAKDMAPGSSVPVTLRFGDGGSITASFPVRNPTGR